MSEAVRLRRFTIAAMFVATGATVLAAFWLAGRPQWESFQASRARERIDPYELTVAGDGDPAKAPAELVAILGDSRLHHWHRVHFVWFASDNSVVSQGADHRLRFWNPDTSKQMFALPVSGAAAVCRDGTTIFIVAEDGSINIWDVATRSVRATLPGHRGAKSLSIAANDDGTKLASGAANRDSFEWKLWDVNQQQELRSVTTDGRFQFLAINGDGGLLATGGDTLVSIWDTATGEERHQLGPFLDSFGTSPCVVCVPSFSPNGRELFTGDAGGRVRIWDTESGLDVGRLPMDGNSVRFVTLGRLPGQLATGSDSCRIWRPIGQAHEWQPETELAAHDSPNAVAFSPQVNVAIACNDHQVRLYDYRGRTRRLAGGDLRDVSCFAWSPDTGSIATGSRDGLIRLWDSARWQVAKSWKGHTGLIHRLAFSPDGRTLVSSSEDGTVVFWDSASGHELQTITGFVPPAKSFAFSFDGLTLATSQKSPGKISIQLWQVGTAKAMTSFQQDSAHLRGDIAFSPDGRTVAMGDTFNSVSLWDVGSGSIRAALGEASYDDVPVAISPDGRFVAAGIRAQSVRVWNLSDGSDVHELKGHDSTIRSVAFSPDSRFLASSAEDGAVRLWLMSTGEEIRKLQFGPQGGVIQQVAFSPSGRFLAVANGNGTAYVLFNVVP